MPAEILAADQRLTSAGYSIEKGKRLTRVDYPPYSRSSARTIEVSFARLKRRGRITKIFDADYYGPGGNQLRFGLYPLLGGSETQLLVSQDLPRGGAQWIARLSPKFKVIFDGQQWGVGREGDDMRIVDLDHDGTYEIIVPITDFYELQDKMSIAQIPLPEIIFKFAPAAGEYLPANSSYPECRSANSESCDRAVDSSDALQTRSRILHPLLHRIYEGKEAEAWSSFNRDYRLADKAEVERRVKTILQNQPTYKFIYKNAHER
jgi:hypothetical protein